MNGQATTPRTSIRFRLEDVPGYLQKYAVEVDTWARQAGGHPVLRITGTFPAVGAEGALS
jgi:hypothetical protein